MKACLALILGSLLVAPVLAPASADEVILVDHDGPSYRVWQHRWDGDDYDHHHTIVGRVENFGPYRLTIRRRDGVLQTIDLKNGTKIFPTGATPQPTQFAAINGYYSRGTFIANRVILRN